MTMHTPFTSDDRTTKGVDKVTRYNWRLTDQKGIFLDVSKHDLIVDHSYQRTTTNSDLKIKRLASNWSWVACGCLIVADRDGKLFVVDGQHRVLAAMKRSDIDDLPCLIFESRGADMEAQAFLRANKDRKPMQALDSFNARLVAGDPTAKLAKNLADSVGLSIGRGQRKDRMQCIGTLEKCLEKHADETKRLWPLIVEVCDRDVHSAILSGMVELERRLIDASLTEPRLSKKLCDAGRDGIIAAIHKSKEYHGAGGDKYSAIGILNLVNFKLRNKVEMR